MTTDDLAGLLREHSDYVPDDDSSGVLCAGCFERLDPDGDSHAGSLAGLAAHQAAVIAAAGWAKWPELEPKKTWYRSLYGNGRVWCESSDPDEVREMSKGKDCTFERYDIYEVTERWQPWEA